MNLTPIFDQYLRHTALPVLELKFERGRGHGRLPLEGRRARLRACRSASARRDHWQILQPTVEWQTLKTPLKKDEFEVATDLYYVTVNKL